MANDPLKSPETSPTAPKVDSVTAEKPTDAAVPSATSTINNWRQAIRDGDDDALKKAVHAEIEGIIAKHGLDQYLTLFLYDEVDSIYDFHSDRLYAVASTSKNKPQDILLILHSKGGNIEPAYLISKALKRISKQKFIVAVPRRAKSAATLLALGADERGGPTS